MTSYLNTIARKRLTELLDKDSFVEWLGTDERYVSPHLLQLNLPTSLDDGIVIGRGTVKGMNVFVASQDGKFMGGSVGEVHGAKLTGLLRRAIQDKPNAVLLLLESGGVRLQELDAGLIAIGEIMRAVLDVREANIPVIALIGGNRGCFGGMSIVAACANAIVMSEVGRLSLAGPEVIELEKGVEELDSHNVDLCSDVMGGKHRFLIGDCMRLVSDQISEFRDATIELMKQFDQKARLTIEELETEQLQLEARLTWTGDH